MKGFRKYYGQKILWYIFTLIIAVILNFILPRLMPGDPTSAIVSKAVTGMTDATAVQKVLEEYTAKFGLDQPMIVQFWEFLKNAIRGDFGGSFSQYPR